MRRKRNWMEENLRYVSCLYLYLCFPDISSVSFNFHNHFVKSVFLQYVRVSCCCPGIVRPVVRSSPRSQQDSSLTSSSLPLSMFSLAVTLTRVGVWGPAGAEHRDQLKDCLFVTELFFFFSFLFTPNGWNLLVWSTEVASLWWAVQSCSPPLHQHFEWAGVLWMLQHLHDEITFLIWLNHICWAWWSQLATKGTAGCHPGVH